MASSVSLKQLIKVVQRATSCRDHNDTCIIVPRRVLCKHEETTVVVCYIMMHNYYVLSGISQPVVTSLRTAWVPVRLLCTTKEHSVVVGYTHTSLCINPLDYRGNYIATSNNEVGTLAVDGWAVTFGAARRGLGGLRPRNPLLAVPNVTAHPSTASEPITVLLYDGPLLCDFSVAIKGLSSRRKGNAGL